ncbi:MAG: 50S ribosomal protein L24e [Candidatus Diapherotrites archaeon]|uniref:50S ribosomal protein L24e n=1 Tax=Candidatus Iainarchaeum sp. TaxID=3101447 RepID=A0A8T4C644_9ARCH|nr:50S ribosomal protein L24e [Candidatus Diapherotrites archaeon]
MGCSFCGKNIPRGTGFMFVRKTGQVYTFCSRKCEHNMIHLERQSRKTRWTKEFAKTKASNLSIREHAQKAKENVKE